MSLLSLVISSLTWTWYLALIPREKVPRRPFAHVILMAVAAFLAAAAIYSAAGAAGSLLAGLIGLISLGLAGFFYFLLAIAALPDPKMKIAVGESLPPFRLRNQDEKWVASQDWRGQRLLLKFFRGHW